MPALATSAAAARCTLGSLLAARRAAVSATFPSSSPATRAFRSMATTINALPGGAPGSEPLASSPLRRREARRSIATQALTVSNGRKEIGIDEESREFFPFLFVSENSRARPLALSLALARSRLSNFFDRVHTKPPTRTNNNNNRPTTSAPRTPTTPSSSTPRPTAPTAQKSKACSRSSTSRPRSSRSTRSPTPTPCPPRWQR